MTASCSLTVNIPGTAPAAAAGTPFTCPAGQTKTAPQDSPVCILTAITMPLGGTNFQLTGYENLTTSNCTLPTKTSQDFLGKPITPTAPSTSLSVAGFGNNNISATTTAQFYGNTYQVASILICPTGYSPTCVSGSWNVFTCGCYLSTITPPLFIQSPTFTCIKDLCDEGEYFCSSENKCKAGGAACSTVTCNNN